MDKEARLEIAKIKRIINSCEKCKYYPISGSTLNLKTVGHGYIYDINKYFLNGILSKKELSNILDILGHVLIDVLLERGHVMIRGIGEFRIVKVKVQKKIVTRNGYILHKKMIDWKATREQMKKMHPDWTNKDWAKVDKSEIPYVYRNIDYIYKVEFEPYTSWSSSMGSFVAKPSLFFKKILGNFFDEKKK